MSEETIKTKIWSEVAESDDPFSAGSCRCAGYDVYGEILPHAGYFEYLYLLYMGERPTRARSRLLEILAVAVANAGPRHPMVHAAMCAGVGGSTRASVLMAALAVGAGQHGGARELVLAMEFMQKAGMNVQGWPDAIRQGWERPYRDGWGPMEHCPGFEPYSARCSTPVVQTLSAFAHISDAHWSAWLHGARDDIEGVVGAPISLIGVCAAAFLDLGFDTAQAEIMWLMLRLPGAAAHALEQEKLGWKSFPFFSDEFSYLGEGNMDTVADSVSTV